MNRSINNSDRKGKLVRNRGNEGKKSAEEKRGDEMRMRDGEETEEKEKEEEEKKISPIQIRPRFLVIATIHLFPQL